ncbi:MAG: right-handed parallel beta-helix repeat-containing protein [Candidatus Hermodarchaeota archaeon]
MKKIRVIKYLMVFILFLVFINSILYIEYNNFTKAKPIEKDNGKIKSNIVRGPIIINGNGDFNLTNGVTPGGTGTYGNPYVIEDFIIDEDGAIDCIFINNTNAYFKIQNCTLKNSEPSGTTIRLNNVSNGLIFDNDISLGAIHLTYSHNNNISDNEILDCKEIYFLFSDNNELRNNFIQNSTNGITLVKSNNNKIIANEIYDCGDYGIKVYFASNNTQIIENYIYNNGGYTGIDQIDIHGDCYGTLVEGNVFGYRGSIPSEFPWLYIILAIAIGAVAIISIVLYRRYRRTKELKHPEPPEFPEPDEPPAPKEQVDLPEPPELDED